jgi:hypothetical protein
MFGCLTEKLTIASPNCMVPKVLGTIDGVTGVDTIGPRRSPVHAVEPSGTFPNAFAC